MSVDNTNHVLNFDLTFTMPDNYSSSYLANNPGFFYGFTLNVTGKNNYGESIGLDGNDVTSSSGTGQAQLQNVSLAPGASSSSIKVYFYGATWSVPTYSESGNSYTVSLKPSYSLVGRSVNYAPWYVTEKYYINANVTVILPAGAMTSMSSMSS